MNLKMYVLKYHHILFTLMKLKTFWTALFGKLKKSEKLLIPQKQFDFNFTLCNMLNSTCYRNMQFFQGQ